MLALSLEHYIRKNASIDFYCLITMLNAWITKAHPPLPSTTVRYFLNGKESSYIISLVIVKIHLFTMFLIPALISTDIFLTPLKSKVMFLCFTVDYYGLYLVLISPSPSRTKHLLTNLVNSVDFKEKKCVHFFRILRKVLQVMREGSEQQKLW